MDSLYLDRIEEATNLINKKKKENFKKKYGLVVSLVVNLVKDGVNIVETKLTEDSDEVKKSSTMQWEALKEHVTAQNGNKSKSDDEELKNKMKWDLERLVEMEFQQEMSKISKTL